MRKMLAALSGAALLLATSVALSHSNGITGQSGKQGANCNSCHTGGATPNVQIRGPLKIDAGATATYRFHIEPRPLYDGGYEAGDGGLDAGDAEAGPMSYGVTGCGIAAQDELTLGATSDGGLKALNGELTHVAPLAPDDAGTATYSFTVTAPQYGGFYTIYASGNAANGDGTQAGDMAGLTTFTVQVIGPGKPGDGGTTGPGPAPTGTGTNGGAGGATNRPAASAADGDDAGCSVGAVGSGGAVGALLVIPAIALMGLRRRRKRC
jgi:hypothetical protein